MPRVEVSAMAEERAKKEAEEQEKQRIAEAEAEVDTLALEQDLPAPDVGKDTDQLYEDSQEKPG